MGDLTTKTVKVPSSKAEEWDDYAEENPEVDSISHLIRLSVEREIQGQYDQPQTLSDDTDDAASGEVLTALRQIQTGMSDLEERMSAIERVGKAEAGYDLQKAVYSFLPEKRDESRVDQWGITASKLAQKLGAEEFKIQETLERLADTTGQVRSLSGGPKNETYWFKQGN